MFAKCVDIDRIKRRAALLHSNDFNMMKIYRHVEHGAAGSRVVRALGPVTEMLLESPRADKVKNL
jgi:hypothetical protein